jgi:tetratricopeptide (TPR) repeat protein
LIAFSELQAMASTIQGFCHMQLGQFDLALEAYRYARNINPSLPQAIEGERQMAAIVEPESQQEGGVPELDLLVKDELNKPEGQQNWDEVAAKLDAYIDEQAKGRPVPENWAPSRKALLRGQTLVMRAGMETVEAKKKELFTQAREQIRQASALDPNDPTIQMAAIRLLAQEPGKGPEQALQLLDKIVANAKDSAQFRALRVDLLFSIRPENLPDQLEAATKGMEEWPANQQALVWSTVSSRYEQLGKYADAQRTLEKAIELAPNNLPARMSLFDLSLKQGDDAGMRKAQSRILEIVKRESDPGYVLTEVKRRIVGQETGASTKEELQEARTMLDEAIKLRDTYSDLYVASGQLFMVLEKDPDKALASFSRALELGATNLNAIGMQVRLLTDRGRLQDARKAMNRIPQELWGAVLDRTAGDVLFSAGEVDKAYAEGEKIAKTRSEDVRTQVWFAELASKAKKPEAAEAALKKALELNPAEPDIWTRLVSLYIEQKRPNDVERTLREAHIALDEEFLPLLSGKYYELQSRWQEAEDIYLSAYAGKDDDIFVTRRMAEFYLTWASQNPVNRGKAAVYLNRILRAANDGKLQPGDQNALWARRQAARMLAQTFDYQDAVKAERLLATAIESGAATHEDQELLVDVLTSDARRDPASREAAVAMLRKMKQQGELTAMRQLQLAQLLAELGDWEPSKKEMEDAIGRHPDDVRLKTAQISLLIRHKEFDEARLQIARLEDAKAAQAGVGQLRLELAAAQGRKADVRAALTSLTPNMRVMNAQQLQYLHDLAVQAELVGDHEYSLNLMREYVRRAPGHEIELARLLALYGNIDEGFTMLRQHMQGAIEDAMSIAIEVIRARRKEAPEKIDAEVERIIAAGLRDDPESARRMVMRAEVLEVQERFAESIEAYKQILSRDDIPKMIRAAAANNMAFLVSLQGPKSEDLELALKYVNEAVEILGPISDILDTRALIYLAQGQYDQAVIDMKQSVKMNATPSKYYHLAVALLGAGDQQAATEAWERAKQEGLTPESASQLERVKVQEFTKKMEAVGSTPQL